MHSLFINQIYLQFSIFTGIFSEFIVYSQLAEFKSMREEYLHFLARFNNAALFNFLNIEARRVLWNIIYISLNNFTGF